MNLKILETVSMQQVWWEMAVCDFAVPVAVPNLHPVFRCSTKCRNLCSNVMSALLRHSDIIICAPMLYIDFYKELLQFQTLKENIFLV
jgi:hypothetical protein